MSHFKSNRIVAIQKRRAGIGPVPCMLVLDGRHPLFLDYHPTVSSASWLVARLHGVSTRIALIDLAVLTAMALQPYSAESRALLLTGNAHHELHRRVYRGMFWKFLYALPVTTAQQMKYLKHRKGSKLRFTILNLMRCKPRTNKRSDM